MPKPHERNESGSFPYKLQPLRIPAGWTILHNTGLYEVDPHKEDIPEDMRWFVFKEDMMQLRHDKTNYLLDLGWYPEGELKTGEYGLVLHKGDFLGPLIHQWRGRDRVALVSEIERILEAVAKGKL